MVDKITKRDADDDQKVMTITIRVLIMFTIVIILGALVMVLLTRWQIQ